jgi:hypothetical protein
MATEGIVLTNQWPAGRSEPLKGAYFWLSVFYLVYCARPEDWVPGLRYMPLAKISGVFAMIGLLMSVGGGKRSLRDLPREAYYLFSLVAFLLVSADRVGPHVFRGDHAGQVAADYFYSGRIRGGDFPGLDRKGPLSTPAGRSSGRHLFESERSGVRHCALAAVLSRVTGENR